MEQVVSPMDVPRVASLPFGPAAHLYRTRKLLKSPTPYLTAAGIALWLFTWWLFSEALQLPRFVKIPGPVVIFREWLSQDPQQGISIFTPEYYHHIYVSCRRIFIAFCIATSVGVPLGLLMGWSRTFREYSFPVWDAAADSNSGLGAARDLDVFPGMRRRYSFSPRWRRCSSRR